MGRDGEEEGRILIGTSGWQYDSWVEPFYGGSAASLDVYAAKLPTVEINGTFYGLPDRNVVADWAARAAEGFVFSAKASRYMTHMKKLKDPTEPVARFFDAIAPLGSSLEVVLFQLPPKWRCNPDRLATFLDALPDSYRYAFEFRDPTWYAEEITALLRAHGAAFCIYHLGDHRSPSTVTSDYVYVRLHGAAGRYRGSYSNDELAAWAGAVTSWARSGRDVYLYFDNDQEAAAPRDAMRLVAMVS
ncbi:MAG: DUF72 domain-containing protein [Spirochaetota bacterium]